MAAVIEMRRRGLKIGATTGYPRVILEAILPRAAAQGYTPDCSVCPDDAGGGRPLPWMCYQNAIRLQVYPMAACVKIGDTVVDIEEGLKSCMWTIGIAKTGNEVGLTEAELGALPAGEAGLRISSARERLLAAGAHAVADSMAEVLPILDQLELRLREGEQP
ncbi:MAG: phosphonoacetaldehyde hydrolase [Acidobacteria bacterium]|nr:phosphonoacetaldehyde hydrolase [Acidobacteriota bacterium]